MTPAPGRSRVKPYDGYHLLADTSVWIEIAKSTTPKGAKAFFAMAVRSGHISSTPIVRMEFYKGARTLNALDEVDTRLDAVLELPLSQGIATIALDAIGDLAIDDDVSHHRIPIGDILIAATAKAHRIGVLTMDWTDYPLLAETPRDPSVSSAGAHAKADLPQQLRARGVAPTLTDRTVRTAQGFPRMAPLSHGSRLAPAVPRSP